MTQEEHRLYMIEKMKESIYTNLQESSFEEAAIRATQSHVMTITLPERIQYDLSVIGDNQHLILVLDGLNDYDQQGISKEQLVALEMAYLKLGSSFIPLFDKFNLEEYMGLAKPEFFFDDEWHHWFDAISIRSEDFFKSFGIIKQLIKEKETNAK